MPKLIRATTTSPIDAPLPSGLPFPQQALPLGAIAAGVGLSLLTTAVLAQTSPQVVTPATEVATDAAAAAGTPAPADPAQKLPTITIKDKVDKRPEAKQSYQAVTTSIGKGKQALRDIPQSVTIVTEKLMDDRNQDTVKEALKNTAGITFLAAEGGEEDVRLRGFSLATAGDIFVDGMRDPAFYDRDTFNTEQIELLRGSASMLFGRGSTGGAVNQASKTPFLFDSSELTATVGRFDYKRVTGDFNVKTGDAQAMRINAMATQADNNGAGSRLDKQGLAGAYRWGIGTRDEVTLSAFHLENNNGINYGLPWIRSTRTDQSTNQIIPGLDPSDYFGMDSDRNKGSADFYTLSHVHRLSSSSEIKSTIRRAFITRDQRASTIRIPNSSGSPSYDITGLNGNSVFNRGVQNKIQDFNAVYAQSDVSTKFKALGYKHEALFGADYALEKKTVYTDRNTVNGRIVNPATGPTKPTTTVGSPDDGAWVDESSRVLNHANGFRSLAVGIYGQDMVHLTPHWKVLGGLRYDAMKGRYEQHFATGRAGESNDVPAGIYEQNIYKWSKRAGLMYQPNDLQSFHFSYGTSFNTSGDTYSYSPKSANTPPESSRNLELGAKLDSADGNLSTRLALFHSTKYKERNTDAPSAADMFLLSGKRHSAGFEADITGRITPKWEVYMSYMFMPVAKVDEGSGTGGGSRKGDRSGLSPRHSGTVWSTYKVTSGLRLGGGINFRSKQAPADIGNPQNGIWSAPGFATFDLMGEYEFDRHYSVKANLTNIGNKYYADSVYRGHYIPGPGRNVQVTLNAKF